MSEDRRGRCPSLIYCQPSGSPASLARIPTLRKVGQSEAHKRHRCGNHYNLNQPSANDSQLCRRRLRRSDPWAERRRERAACQLSGPALPVLSERVLAEYNIRCHVNSSLVCAAEGAHVQWILNRVAIELRISFGSLTLRAVSERIKYESDHHFTVCKCYEHVLDSLRSCRKTLLVG